MEGFLCKRRKPCVISTTDYWYLKKYGKGDDPQAKVEPQYRAFLMLYKPWRQEGDMKGEFATFREAWDAWNAENPNSWWQKSKQLKDKVEKAAEIVAELEIEAAQELEAVENARNEVVEDNNAEDALRNPEAGTVTNSGIQGIGRHR